MSPSKRILINVIATYGRSLYAMVCGLVASRWALSILGDVNYGLYGVIGSLTLFVSFINTLMASAVGRYYAYSVGAAKRSDLNVAVDDCVRWFNTALAVHTVLPLLLVSLGYPMGVHYICNVLTCPPDRIVNCIWVWRFTCLSCFVGMCNVPFQAMFVAKQEIAELTIYSVAASTAKLIALYYMVSHSGDWLVSYALCMSLVSVLPNILIMLRARLAFSECRVVLRYIWNWDYFVRLLKFAMARFMALFSNLCSVQGVALVVNAWLGPKSNATLTLGTVVSNQASTLANSFNNALQPAITNAVGEGKIDYAHKLNFRACMFSALGMIIFVIPLALEMDYILRLWLKNPPDGLVDLAKMIMLAAVVERFTDGFWMEILAFGKIAKYQMMESFASLSSLILAIAFMVYGGGVVCVGWAMLVSKVANCCVQLKFGRDICRISLRKWGLKVFIPIVAVSGISLVFGSASTYLFGQGLYRLLLTVGICESTFIPLVWYLVLDIETRTVLRQKLIGSIRCLTTK